MRAKVTLDARDNMESFSKYCKKDLLYSFLLQSTCFLALFWGRSVLKPLSNLYVDQFNLLVVHETELC